MSTYTPNFSVGNDWRQTFKNAWTQLRTINFVIDNTFSWGDFNPLAFDSIGTPLNWSGMVASTINVRRARYLKIWKFVWFSIDIEATLAAPLAAIVYFYLPNNIQAAGERTFIQGGGARIDLAALEAGVWFIVGGNNAIGFRRHGGTNYTATDNRWYANGFIEVI